MKENSTRMMRSVRIVSIALCTTVALGCTSTGEPSGPVHSAVSAPSLGMAASFRVLGGSTVTNTGATTVSGDLGVHPGLAITGFPPGIVIGGATHAGDATALQAQSDVTAAYDVLAGHPCAADLTGRDLGGLTLTQGVYCFSTSAQLTGTLTLDAEGDPGAVFVFQIGSTLTTASSASVVFINGGQDCRTFWQVGSSATLGTDTVFTGSILALTSIALQTRSSLAGRALARNGAVTMDTSQVFGGACADVSQPMDGGVADSGGAGADAGGDDAGMDANLADAGTDAEAADAGTDAELADAGGGDSDAGTDAGVEDAGASDAGEGLCCGGSLCGGASCVDLSTDGANCGSCGHACLAGELCAAGACAPCATLCAGACADLASDRNNCGACGNVCAVAVPCIGGSCAPCATTCDGSCVDLGNDHGNCGSCGHVCLASEVCAAGSCAPCAFTLCGGWCLNLDYDARNCGSCGSSCAPGESCNLGACVCL